MTSDEVFKSIRPYIGEEVPAAVERLRGAGEFLELFSRMTGESGERIAEGRQASFVSGVRLSLGCGESGRGTSSRRGSSGRPWNGCWRGRRRR